MNTEQDYLNARIRTTVISNGLADFRRQALKSLKLKTVIKESHCSQIQHLAFNSTETYGNLFATVGKDQATIYDDMHMAEHIAVVANLSLSGSIEAAKDAFSVTCWINSCSLSSHPYGDALLAVAGSDPYVHIISVAEAAVVTQLPLPHGGSSSSVVDLSAAAECPGLVLLLCKDGTMQLWQAATGVCCCCIKTDAFTAVLHPSGSYAVTSSRSGKLSTWNLQPVLSTATAPESRSGGVSCSTAVTKQPLHVESSGLDGSVVDCMRFLADDRLAVKTADGRMAVLSMPHGKVLSSWRVPGCSSATASYSSRCSFGHTRDGHYVCVGNHNATAYVFDSSTGLQVARVEAIRVQGSVRACGLSEDCRHLLMVVGSGYIFRFEHRPKADNEADEGNSSDLDDSMQEADDQHQHRSRSSSVQPEFVAGSTQIHQHTGSAGPSRFLQQHQQQQQALVYMEAGQASNVIASATDTMVGSIGDANMFKNVIPNIEMPGSVGFLDGMQDVEAAPAWIDKDGCLAGAVDTQSAQQLQDDALAPHPEDLTSSQPKRQKVDHDMELQAPIDSPLVFRPTPTK